MKRLIGGVFLLLTMCVGCGKKDSKKSFRSIHDHSHFAGLCAQAVEDPATFESFKQNALFNFFFENNSYEEGLLAAHRIRDHFPHLIERLEVFRSNDHVGSPVTYEYGSFGSFSPTTLRYIEIAGHLEEQFGRFSELDVVQIGAGYGGLCNILHQAFSFKSFTIIDLPPQLELAKKYLDFYGIKNVEFIPLDNVSDDLHYDLVISDAAFAEFDGTVQERLLGQLAAHAPSGFLIGYQFPKHFGLNPLSPEGVEKVLKKWHENIRLEKKEFSPKNNHYIVQWGSNPMDVKLANAKEL